MRNHEKTIIQKFDHRKLTIVVAVATNRWYSYHRRTSYRQTCRQQARQRKEEDAAKGVQRYFKVAAQKREA